MYIKSLFILSILNASLFAAPSSSSELKNFYYKKGYEAAKAKERAVGYEIALTDFKALLIAYEDDIKATNAGKIMIEKGKISYPRIYKEKVDGSYRIKIMPSKVEEDFSVDDLFILPLLHKKRSSLQSYRGNTMGQENQYNPAPQKKQEVKQKTPAALLASATEKPSNSFSLPNLNKVNQRRPVRHISAKKTQNTLYIAGRSHKTEEALSAFGINAQLKPNGYNIIFSGKRDREKFCDYLTGDKTCSSLR